MVVVCIEIFGWKIEIIYKYAIIPCNVIFVIWGFISNGYLLIKLNRSRLTPHPVGKHFTPYKGRQNFYNVLLKSQFVVPILITLIFTLFLTSAAVEPFVDQRSSLNFVTFMLFNAMMFVDSLIYLLLERQIRNLIMNRIRKWKAQRSVVIEYLRQKGNQVHKRKNDSTM